MSSFYTFNNEFEIGKRCFVVAEIGQNHQGCLVTAKRMIKIAKKIVKKFTVEDTLMSECGADCVKFQKSNLEQKFTQKALQQPYQSVNSFGNTYGDHKRFLEFSIEEYKELILYAQSNEILLTASAMDKESYNELRSLDVPFIKIGSGDNNNWIMLEKLSKDKDMPIIVSTGMQDIDDVQKLHEIFSDRNNIAILHCVSSYPTKSHDVRLRLIEVYQSLFPHKVIGYSGHENTPIVISLGAVALGAKIIERHFTLDKSLKGSDHSCSLVPDELALLVRMIRLLEQKEINSKDTDSVIELVKSVILETGTLDLLEDLDELRSALCSVKAEDKQLLDCEMNCFNKLRKTLVYAHDVTSGSLIQKSDFAIKVNTTQGISTEKTSLLFGKMLLRDVSFEESVQFEHFVL